MSCRCLLLPFDAAAPHPDHGRCTACTVPSSMNFARSVSRKRTRRPTFTKDRRRDAVSLRTVRGVTPRTSAACSMLSRCDLAAGVSAGRRGGPARRTLPSATRRLDCSTRPQGATANARWRGTIGRRLIPHPTRRRARRESRRSGLSQVVLRRGSIPPCGVPGHGTCQELTKL